MKSRRHFLTLCSAAAAGLSMAPSALSILPVPEATLPSFIQFASLLNTRFAVSDGLSNSQELVLYDASTKSPDQALHESFRLMFRGSTERSLEQNTYDFHHEKLGAFSIFIVPVGSTKGHYEAIFNLSKQGPDHRMA